jgi:dipeptidyl aminopeptidase/acylaminoacyl peptidase
VGFFAESKVKRIDIDSGVVQVLDRALVPAGGTWNEAGVIIYPMVPDSPLLTVTSDGANSAPLTTLASQQTGHRAPQFLPDGRHYLYYAMGSPEVRGTYVGEIGARNSRRLIDSDTPAVYAATGHLFYVNQRTLFAQRFDPVRLEIAGDPQPVAEEVTSGERANIAALSASAAGPIAYRTGSPGGKRLFVWFDRSGRKIVTLGPGEGFGPSYASVSPDGRRLALQRTDAGNTDIWLLDLQRNTPVRFTSEPEAEIAPIWSPLGDRIVFSSRRTGVFNLHHQAVTAKASEEVLLTEQSKQATDWSHDGRFLLFRSLDPELDWDIWAMPVSGKGDEKPFPVVRSKFEERDAQFSPDGKWIAFQSNESGRFEIYVQPFQDSGERSRISINGGVQPRWRRDGRELFYITLDGQLVAVPVALSSSSRAFESGAAVPLFHARVGAVQDISLPDYIVSPDGQRFLLDTVVEEAAAPIVVILNWKPRLQ